MARPPKEGSRKNNQNYSPVTAQIPKSLGKKLRLFVAQEETTISEVVEAALDEYIGKRMVQVLKPTPAPETLSDLVKSNYFELIHSDKLKPDRIQELAFGGRPVHGQFERFRHGGAITGRRGAARLGGSQHEA